MLNKQEFLEILKDKYGGQYNWILQKHLDDKNLNYTFSRYITDKYHIKKYKETNYFDDLTYKYYQLLNDCGKKGMDYYEILKYIHVKDLEDSRYRIYKDILLLLKDNMIDFIRI